MNIVRFVEDCTKMTSYFRAYGSKIYILIIKNSRLIIAYCSYNFESVRGYVVSDFLKRKVLHVYNFNHSTEDCQI